MALRARPRRWPGLRRPQRSRRPQQLGAAFGVAALAVGVAACQGPAPRVSINSGATTITVAPSNAAGLTGTGAATAAGATGSIGAITAVAGTNLLISVPGSVARGSWSVVSTDATGPLDDNADSSYNATVRDSHAVRVQVPFGSGSYLLLITQGSSDIAKATRVWAASVTITRAR